MKQSYVNAVTEAKKLSVEHENVVYYVFDKPRCRTEVHSAMYLESPYFRYLLFKRGYAPTVKFMNGVESRA